MAWTLSDKPTDSGGNLNIETGVSPIVCGPPIPYDGYMPLSGPMLANVGGVEVDLASDEYAAWYAEHYG